MIRQSVYQLLQIKLLVLVHDRRVGEQDVNFFQIPVHAIDSGNLDLCRTGLPDQGTKTRVTIKTRRPKTRTYSRIIFL
jgi:hypothetical protein